MVNSTDRATTYGKTRTASFSVFILEIHSLMDHAGIVRRFSAAGISKPGTPAPRANRVGLPTTGDSRMNGKCPKCEQIITNVNLEHGPIGNAVTGPLVPGYVAICPRCRTVLGVMPDPASIVRQVVEKITGKKAR